MDLTADDIFQKICEFAVYAREHLHLNFAELDKVANPSFGIIIKYCELSIEILKSEAHNGTEHAVTVMENFQSILDAIVDRDNDSLVDCMAVMDEVFDNEHVKPFVKNCK